MSGPTALPVLASASSHSLLGVAAVLPADKKERDPTFRKQPQDVAASESRNCWSMQ